MREPTDAEVHELIVAATQGDCKRISAFAAQYPAALDHKGQHGQTALVSAAYEGQAMAVAVLLDSDAGVDVPNDDGHTPLMAAAIGNEEATFRLLLEAGADMTLVDKRGRDVRALAADRKHDNIIALIDAWAEKQKQAARADVAETRRIEILRGRKVSSPLRKKPGFR